MCVQKACVGAWCTKLECVYISMVYVHHPLFTSGPSQTGSGTGADNGGDDVNLSQNVYGELVILIAHIINDVLLYSQLLALNHNNNTHKLWKVIQLPRLCCRCSCKIV